MENHLPVLTPKSYAVKYKAGGIAQKKILLPCNDFVTSVARLTIYMKLRVLETCLNSLPLVK